VGIAPQLFSRRQQQHSTNALLIVAFLDAVLPLRIINALTNVEINKQTKIVWKILAWSKRSMSERKIMVQNVKLAAQIMGFNERN